MSEGPQERSQLQQQLESMLTAAGAPPGQVQVHVLSAYKQGYSWLMDDIVPQLAGKGAARITIACAPNVDAKGMSAVNSRARWIQELYPVDEMIAKALNIPLDKIEISEMPAAAATATDPTYDVHAYNAAGQEILHSAFTETTAEAPYNGTYPHYDYVKVETGWVRLTAGSRVLLDKRIETDPEVFWTHYQTKTLPRVFEYVMAQAHGRPEAEYQPMFDTLRLDIHMSEPDYNIGLDKERISMLEALQEDTFYSTENFFYMIGDMEMGQHWDYPGRIIPIVHPSEDGKDGHVHIEFYAKPAANPLVQLSWTDAQGHRHTEERDLPALRNQPDPRLIEARVKAGASGVESLTWTLPADYVKDDYRDWLKVVAKDTIQHTIFSVEQAQGQIHWLEAMHQAGLYRDDLAYPNLGHLAMELVLPPDRTNPTESVPQRVAAAWTVPPPATKRPMIADYRAATAGGPYDKNGVGAGLRTGAAGDSSTLGVGAGLRARAGGSQPIVQWDQPIDPAENAQILARLATYPGVNAYWMGRSYLGINIWAADVMLPSPSVLRSWAKETTVKAAAIYSGRQHANEVSSTSHIDKLGEQLVTDPATRDMLEHVNVVLHPITNPDGAQLSIDLYHVTPDNLLHPGYHGSLTSDVVAGQWEHDPIYPESRTRRQLFEAWLPDTFLNPHGYPSHEWVQPFSGYTGWVISRMGAHSGREWWLPRGWFTSLYYLRDPAYPYSEQFTYDLRNRIADAISQVPGLMPLENRMNARYQRWGQRWDPDWMMQPIVGGVRIYMSLKGTAPSGGSSAFMTRFPDVTYDDGYTEAPDETAYGPYLHLLASAGLAFDRVHLKYLADGQLRITRTEKAAGSGVSWSVSRERPILPSSEPKVPVPQQ
ncbi:MAG TPA: M14 family metallopeptidase [Vicinamibacterales bacterium]